MSLDANAFKSLVDKYAIPLGIGTTLQSILKQAEDGGLNSDHLASTFATNQAYVHFLKKLDLFSKRVTEWETEDPSLQTLDRVIAERLFRLVGKASVRNLTACIAMNRMSGSGLPRLKSKANDKKNALKIVPREQLKIALQTFDFCVENHVAGVDSAFRAGMHYDFILALFIKNEASRDQIKTVEEVYKEGLLTARIAMNLASLLKRAQLSQNPFSLGLALPLGKFAMSILFPPELKEKSWSGVKTEFKALGKLEFTAYRALERSRLGTTYFEMSSLLTSFAMISPELAPVLRAFRVSYTLSPKDAELGTLLSVAEILAAHILGVGVDLQTVWEPWQRRWLEKNGLTPDKLKSLAEKAKGGK